MFGAVRVIRIERTGIEGLHGLRIQRLNVVLLLVRAIHGIGVDLWVRAAFVI